MVKPRLWLFLLFIGILWYLYEKNSVSLWSSFDYYTGNLKRGGYFLIGGIVLYVLFFQKDILTTIFTKAAALDNDPRLNRVSLVRDYSSVNNYSMPGTRTKYKRNVSALLKKKVAASQQWKCASCHSLLDETYEVDHTIALEHGGTNDIHNLRALCPHCHRKKTVAERL